MAQKFADKAFDSAGQVTKEFAGTVKALMNSDLFINGTLNTKDDYSINSYWATMRRIENVAQKSNLSV